MQSSRQFTAIIAREGRLYVAQCAELDVASQGASVEEARANLVEAIQLFLETVSPDEMRQRFHDEVFVTHIKVSIA